MDTLREAMCGRGIMEETLDQEWENLGWDQSVIIKSSTVLGIVFWETQVFG